MMRARTIPLRLVLLVLGMSFLLPALIVPYSAWKVLEAFPGTAGDEEHFECGLVFGAAVHSVADPGPGILRRVKTGVRLYQDGRIERLIFTGGRGSASQQSEAEVMKSVAGTLGVPEEDMRTEEESSSTQENLRNARPLLEDCASLVGISDPYHLGRIGLLASHEGISLKLIPTDEHIRQLFLLQSIFREILGYAYYTVQPWL